VNFVLTLIMCAGMSGECMPAYNWPTRFDSMYNCLQFGYDEASKKLKEIGPEEVNKYYVHIKFYCSPITTT